VAGLKEKIMKLSARNQLKGNVTEVHKGTTTAHVVVDLGHGMTLTSTITNEAVEELGRKVGDSASAVIKA
jgi:molybdopterin-binding protein